MCYLSTKFSDMSDPNPPYTFDRIRKKPISNKKRSHSLTLRAKVKIIAKTKANALGNKNHPRPKKFEQRFPCNWCEANEDADTDISKTICRLPQLQQ